MDEHNVSADDKVRSIRFNRKFYDAIQFAAENAGMSFSSYAKTAILSYMQATSQQQDLMESLDPEHAAKVQKTFFTSLNEIRDMLSATMVNQDRALNRKFDVLQKIVEKAVYYQLFYFRAMPEHERAGAERLAEEAIKKLLSKIHSDAQHGAF